MRRHIVILALQCVCGIIMTLFYLTRAVGIAMILLAFLWALLLFIEMENRRKKLAELQKKIGLFIQLGAEPAFSLADDEYAGLENSIAELAHLTAVQKQTVRRENQDTVDFITDVSHQLKTPLASLRLYSEMQDGPHAQKQLILIDRMEKDVQSLLRLQKLRAGAYELKFAPLALTSVIKDVWEELQPLYPGRQFSMNGDAGLLRCDEFWMGEAFKNLLKNACEHTAENGAIRVELTKLEKSILVTLEDDGGGVPDETLPQLFRRFYSPSHSQNGTGLGLAITKAIVEKHHGSISAQNAGAGLRMTLCLPVLDGMFPIL